MTSIEKVISETQKERIHSKPSQQFKDKGMKAMSDQFRWYEKAATHDLGVLPVFNFLAMFPGGCHASSLIDMFFLLCAIILSSLVC
ncbi:hypothetical protein U1Q18_049973 [Sarracenia purpurea var. burkii]